jgi:thiol-disulfide isomerase/thioredoxin
MSPSFLGSVNKVLENYYTPLLIIFLLALFGYVGYVIYNKYKTREKATQGNDDIANEQGADTVTVPITLYYVDWCPHSNKIMPDWNIFKEEYNKREINGYKLDISDINLTNEDGSKDNVDGYPKASTVKQITTENNIENFPTIKMYKNEEVINFDAKVTINNLEQFVETLLKE